MMLVTLGALSLPFAERMAPQTKEGERLSTASLQRNHQLLSQIYSDVMLPGWFVREQGTFSALQALNEKTRSENDYDDEKG